MNGIGHEHLGSLKINLDEKELKSIHSFMVKSDFEFFPVLQKSMIVGIQDRKRKVLVE